MRGETDMTGSIHITEERIHLLLQDVLGNIIKPVLILVALLALLFILDFIGDKIKRRSFHVFAGIAVLCAGAGLAGLEWYSTMQGSIIISELTLALVMTAVVFILNLIKLSALDYAVMFACFACISRFSWFNFSFLGISLTFLLIFFTLLTIYKIRIKRLNGQLFHIWLTFILAALEGYIIYTLFDIIVRPLGYTINSGTEKLLVWSAVTLILVALNITLIYLIKRFFGKYFNEINQMGKAYPKIERFFIYNSAGILVLMTLLHFGYFGYAVLNGIDHMPTGAFTMFSVFVLVIQLSFLIMIFKITWLKDNLQSKDLESKSLAAYMSNLEKNMDDIRNIKHDIKNIFLTMGRFVEQSENVDMQAFYREKITPFASGEIAKNDMHGKLAAIDSEPLKAFLYYKISQAVQRGIAIDLDISPLFSASRLSIEVIDIVRILGALLDNAIEESVSLPHGVIAIKLSQNDELTSLMIKNSVSPERKAVGIKAGVSSKGGGRGKGLMIVKGILGKYDCVTLNSYFQDDCFAQNIVIYRLAPN